MVGDRKRIVPHAKTHKSKDTLKILIDNGITRHKTSTINELETLAECKPEDIPTKSAHSYIHCFLVNKTIIQRNA